MGLGYIQKTKYDISEKEMSRINCILAEFATIRAEILDRLKLRTQYELLAFSIFMGFFGISLSVGYSIIILMLIQVFLAPLIFMMKELLKSVFKLGCYLAARIEVEKFWKNLPWEFFSLQDGIELGNKKFKSFTSSHMWLFFIPVIISYSYFIILVIFSNLFLDVLGGNATWDLFFVNSNNIVKVLLISLVSIIFIVNIYLMMKYHKLNSTRLGVFEKYCKRLRKLYESKELMLAENEINDSCRENVSKSNNLDEILERTEENLSNDKKPTKDALIVEYEILNNSVEKRSSEMLTIDSFLLPISIAVVTFAIIYRQSLGLNAGFFPLISLGLVAISYFFWITANKINEMVFNRLHEIENELQIKGHSYIRHEIGYDRIWWKLRRNIWHGIFGLFIITYGFITIWLFGIGGLNFSLI